MSHLDLRRTDQRILRGILECGKPVNAHRLVKKMNISRSTLLRRLPILIEQRMAVVAKESVFKRTGKTTRNYTTTVQGLLTLSLSDPQYILCEVDLLNFFRRHGIDDLNVDALRGMLKAWVFYGENAPRIDGKVFYSKAEFPDAEFLSNVTRGIFFLVLGRTSPFKEIGEASFLSPNSFEVALRVEGKLSQEETEAVLLALYKKGIHFKNSEMALLSEALWEEKFGTSRKRDFWLGGFFPKEGNLFRVGAKLNPDILRDDIASGKKQSLDVLEGIQDVVVTKIHRSKTEA